MTIRPSRQAIGRQGGGAHLLVRAVPPAPPARQKRRPVALALVIDRSGSMGEPADNAAGVTGAAMPVVLQPGKLVRGAIDTGRRDKLSFVRAATRRLLDLMHDGDAVSLVTFDDKVAVVKPLTVLNDATRRTIGDAVDRLHPGGSTFLEGGLQAGLEQLSEATREHYGCKLVLLSDGQANVGEQRPAVLSEVAAGAAHRGITISTLGVGFDYNIALMSSLAEAGNGDFNHIGSLDALDEILREEFTTAAEVTARDVHVTVDLPERLAFGTNLNGYRQDGTERGFEVHLGDLVRPKEFLFEVTTPVPLEGDRVTVAVRATYRDAQDAARESTVQLALRVCAEDDAQRERVDDDVISRLLIQLPARAEMDAALAYEAGDVARAGAAIRTSRQAMASVQRYYGDAATDRIEMTDWESRLTDLSTASMTGPLHSNRIKTMFAASYDLSRSRPPRDM
ncbi:MAG TPA: VWA domain-containing protein [Candidatus Dormibacteraeota bacterium]